MKKTISIIALAVILLTGCSKAKPIIEENTFGNTVPNQKEETQNIKSEAKNSGLSLTENIDMSKSPFTEGYYDYTGTINNNLKIHMSIYPLQKEVVGTYFYDNQRKDIKLVGKAGENSIVLYEYDESGKKTGIFEGKIKATDIIEGTWISSDGNKKYPFKMELLSNLPGVAYGKRYSIAVGNNRSDKEVENFISKLQKYISDNSKEQLAENVSYPITVKIKNQPIKIETKQEFIKKYDEIFYPNYKQIISKAYTRNLFANWKGIMFGENMYNLWINEVNSKLMITGINN